MAGKSLLALAALVVSGPALARECYPDVPLHMGGPRPEIDIAINGKPQRVVFDTGASRTVINIDTADALGVQREGRLLPPFDRMHAASGYQGRIDSAQVGAFPLGRQSVPVMPVPLRTPAILSPNSFGDNFLRIDFAAGIMKICPKPKRIEKLGPAQRYSTGAFQLPTIPVQFGDQTVAAHLDTGSPVNLILPMAYAQKFTLEGGLVEIGRARNHAAEMPIYKAKVIGKIRIGTLELTDPEVRFSDVVPAVNVGLGVLRRFQVTLDPANKRLWIAQAR